MAITDFPELKAAVTNWMARADVAGDAEDFIALGEVGLSRELGPIETDAALAGVASSRRIDISSLSMVEPIALFLAEAGQDEIELTMKADGTFPYLDSTGRPRFWAIDGTNIDFDRPIDEAYPFRFRYRQKFALSAGAPTNWLLTNHPDVYLAACLVWGGVFIQDDPTAARWAALLARAVPSVRHAIAQSKRGIATMDAGMPRPTRFGIAWSQRNEL